MLFQAIQEYLKKIRKIFNMHTRRQPRKRDGDISFYRELKKFFILNFAL